MTVPFMNVPFSVLVFMCRPYALPNLTAYPR